MDCLCLATPVSILLRRRYRRLSYDEYEEGEGPVTVVAGREKMEFLVDPIVLEQNPFRMLIETLMRRKKRAGIEYLTRRKKRVIFLDVDGILIEHILWLMKNDCCSLWKLNLIEILDFYAQDDDDDEDDSNINK